MEDEKEIVTADPAYSAARYKEFYGVRIGDKERNIPAEGRVVCGGTTINYHNGFFEDYVDDGGLLQPAIQCDDGHVEYCHEGLLDRSNGLPAVISNYSNRVEWWSKGRLVKIRDYIQITKYEENKENIDG